MVPNSITDISLPLVSVIVPVYNVQEYLIQCLHSLSKQTLKDIEIIVIDDGSTDRSGMICDEYAAVDARFRVVHQKNIGLSGARNVGLNLARSDYIMFVDSDDWVEPEFCELPYSKAKENSADIVAFHTRGKNKRTSKRKNLYPDEGIISTGDALTKYWLVVGTVVWNKLYRKVLFEEIRYPEGHLAEDISVMHRLINNANRVVFLDKGLYNYRLLREGSITASRSTQFLEDSIRYNIKRVNDLRQWGYDYQEEEKKLALYYLVCYGKKKEYSAYFEKILRESRGFTQNASLKLRSMFFVFKISPFLFDCIAIISGKRHK